MRVSCDVRKVPDSDPCRTSAFCDYHGVFRVVALGFFAAAILAACGGGLGGASTCADWKEASDSERLEFLRDQGVEDFDQVAAGCEIDGNSADVRLSAVVEQVCARQYCGDNAEPRIPGTISSTQVEDEIRESVTHESGALKEVSCDDREAIRSGSKVDCEVVTAEGKTEELTVEVTSSGDEVRLRIN